MRKLEHIGIAIKDLEAANALFSQLFGESHYKIEKVETEGVSTSFFKIGETKIELLEATDDNSPIHKFIQKRGEGVHHLAFEVDDIEAEIRRLDKAGFSIINKEPRKGADNKRVAFLHPKSTNGVLVELCQTMDKE